MNSDSVEYIEQIYENEFSINDIQTDQIPTKYSNYFLKGIILTILSKHGEAILVFDKAIQQDYRNHRAYFHKGKCLLHLGYYQESIIQFDTALDICPNTTDVYNYKGIALAELGMYEEALDNFDKYLEDNSQDPLVYNSKGVALYFMDNYIEALNSFNKSIELDPEICTTYINKGIILYELGSFSEAIIEFNKAIQLDDQYCVVYNYKGLSLFQLNFYESAIYNFDKAIEMFPEYVEAYHNKGQALHCLSKFQQAIEQYDKAIQLNPFSEALYNNKGLAQFKLKQYSQSLEQFNNALELNPNFEVALCNKGLLLTKMNKYQEAIKIFNQALYTNPYLVEAYINKGVALQYLELNIEATQVYDTALLLEPLNYILYNNQGKAFYSLGKYNQAYKYYCRALQLNPFNAVTYNNLGILLYSMDLYQEALIYFNQAILIDQYNIQALNNKVHTLYQLGKHNEALQEFQIFIRKTNLDEDTSTQGIEELLQNQKLTIDELTIFQMQISQGLIDIKIYKDKVVDKAKQKIQEKLLEIKKNDLILLSKLKQIKKNSNKCNNNCTLEKLNILIDAKNEIIYELVSSYDNYLSTQQYITLLQSYHTVQVNWVSELFRNLDNNNNKEVQIDKNQLIKSIKDLKAENQGLYEYVVSFYWTITNYVAAYLNTVSYIQIHGQDLMTQRPLENLFVEGAIKMFSNISDFVIEEASEMIPLVGSVIKDIDSITQEICVWATLQQRINTIKNIFLKDNTTHQIFNQQKRQHLSLLFASVAYGIALKKKNEIINNQDFYYVNTAVDSQQFIEETIESIHVLFAGNSFSLFDSYSSQLALQDVALLLSLIYTQSDNIFSQIQRKISIQDLMIDLVASDKIKELLQIPDL